MYKQVSYGFSFGRETMAERGKKNLKNFRFCTYNWKKNMGFFTNSWKIVSDYCDADGY